MSLSALRFLLAIFGAVMMVIPLLVSAQTLGGSDPFTLSISPQYPLPYGQVIVTPTSGGINLSTAVMTVRVAGKEIYKGSSQPTAVLLGALGSLTTITVTMIVNGTPYVQTVNIRPEDVVLVAEPVSSAPVLYPGKPLVPLEGAVRVVAIAKLAGSSGAVADTSRLSYLWTVDGTRIENASGVGRSTLLVASPLQYRQRTVSVLVQTVDGSLVGGASLSLTAQEPTVRIYQQDPLLGVLFDHAVAGTFSLTGTEATLFAAPYSFPTSNNIPTLTWFLNGVRAQVSPSVTLRPAGRGQGTASLSLAASSGRAVTTTTNLSVLFGAPASTNFFGL